MNPETQSGRDSILISSRLVSSQDIAADKTGSIYKVNYS